jgi:glycosyltransferase involved in cell wall biosynthesis
MRKIKLGIVFDQAIYSGGGYQQSLNAVQIVKKLPKDLADVVFYTTITENIKNLRNYKIEAKFIKISIFSKIRIFFYRKIRNIYLFNFFRFFEKSNPREKIFIKDKIDIIYFLSPTSWPIDLEKTNYISTLWDLCHLDELEFPEVRCNREFERRENNYREILPKAVAILVESNSTKKKLITKYGIAEDRIYFTPFKPALATINIKNKITKSLDVKKKYNLNVPYIFYPAQFWAHKNHFYLLEGLHYLKDKFQLEIGAIFAGNDRGNLKYIKDSVKKFNLEKLIRFVGFVSNEEVAELYSQSIALIMPTYFGPTNLPPLEAFEIGVPVLYPDRGGLKDQVGDAALLIDLNDFKTMANQLKSLYFDSDLRERLIQNGKNKLNFYNSFNQVEILSTILKNFAIKKNCWE